MQRIAQCGIFLSLSSGHKAAPLDKLCDTNLLLKTRHVILQGKELDQTDFIAVEAEHQKRTSAKKPASSRGQDSPAG